jgi:hypothetical protein
MPARSDPRTMITILALTWANAERLLIVPTYRSGGLTASL